jgi:protein-disulfide isomerase
MGKKWLSAVQGAAMCAALLFSAIPMAAQRKTSAGTDAVAKIQGNSISMQELLKAAGDELEKLDMQKLQFETNFQKNRHQILENTLNRILDEKILDAEAAKQGVSRDALLAKALEGKVAEPTPEQIDQFYQANRQRINSPQEKVVPQIQQFLKNQNANKAKAEYLSQLKKDYAVANLLAPFRVEVRVDGRPLKGPESAPVTLVEFSDFQCPYCSTMSANIRQVLEKYGKQVRLVFRQFPLTQIHNNAQKAAEAGFCAADAGKFWEMHDLMFQSQDKLSDADLVAKAVSLSLDEKTFGACLSSGRYAAKVKEDLMEGVRLGVTGTPSLFVNGRPLGGVQSIEDISKIIDEELKLADPFTKLASVAGIACGGSQPPCPPGM